ncbi:twin-arginine translocase subunit TatC [Streptomyces sp. SL13]|uniref:Sec-independent protein translocase protein TatC n=2 Tax=Streptantibioticus silvisoli TaxID=2705255 RepID=A0AA90HAC5_9ACTN|nr:twin-arginine translocase subunit TatC [Streptantibioticus silvisoli]MDI5966965.1 twin-arginine translocase subunit TatC [Streptantibioticus silvisoli]MDI5974206.1 twin-arginine translocase subunit TatC [Streptantibioticus silvisoli]
MAKTGKIKDPEGRMPLADHLRELRNRLVKSLIGVAVVCVATFVYYHPIINFLDRPLNSILHQCTTLQGHTAAGAGQHCAVLTLTGLLGPFSVILKVGLTLGIVLSAPIWLYQLWGFLAPGLYQKEKRYALGFMGAAVPLFIGGAVLAYVILPTTAKVLIDLTPDKITNIVPLDTYLDLLTRLVLVFGFSFEAPLILVMLNFTGVLTGKRLLSWWRWIIMGITVFAAIATPTTDPLTMLVLATPIALLFFVAIGVALLHDKRKARRAAAEETDPDKASDLDLTPEDLPEVEPVTTPPSLSDGDDGFDDAT